MDYKVKEVTLWGKPGSKRADLRKVPSPWGYKRRVSGGSLQGNTSKITASSFWWCILIDWWPIETRGFSLSHPKPHYLSLRRACSVDKYKWWEEGPMNSFVLWRRATDWNKQMLHLWTAASESCFCYPTLNSLSSRTRGFTSPDSHLLPAYTLASITYPISTIAQGLSLCFGDTFQGLES